MSVDRAGGGPPAAAFEGGLDAVLDEVFKAYDVRGRAGPGGLDEELAERIGAGFARYADAPEAALGRDCRVSSPALAAAFAEGLVSQGVDVVDLGQAPTEVVYHYSGLHRTPGAMVTASHNPAGYNGFKLCLPGAAPIGMGTGLEEIREYVRKAGRGGGGRSAGGAAGGGRRGRVRNHDAVDDYLEHLLEVVDPAGVGGLLTAVDGGNGMAGVVIGRLFERLDARLLGLYLAPDGSFPNHPADPLDPVNLAALQGLVRSEGADLGVAFDGDADRAVFVDEAGVPLPGSAAVALIAAWFLARRPGARIVHNLICSRAVAEAVRAAGGTPVRTRVGHSFIKAVMAETGAVFGGEHSGHYYFGDNYGADSGMLAMLVLLTVLTEAGAPLSELRRGCEPYALSGEINTEVGDPAAAVEAAAAAYAGWPQDRLDGLTVDLGDRWFNLRPSNTEPLLRLNAEAPDREAVDALVSEVKDLIARFA